MMYPGLSVPLCSTSSRFQVGSGIPTLNPLPVPRGSLPDGSGDQLYYAQNPQGLGLLPSSFLPALTSCMSPMGNNPTGPAIYSVKGENQKRPNQRVSTNVTIPLKDGTYLGVSPNLQLAKMANPQGVSLRTQVPTQVAASQKRGLRFPIANTNLKYSRDVEFPSPTIKVAKFPLSGVQPNSNFVMGKLTSAATTNAFIINDLLLIPVQTTLGTCSLEEAPVGITDECVEEKVNTPPAEFQSAVEPESSFYCAPDLELDCTLVSPNASPLVHPPRSRHSASEESPTSVLRSNLGAKCNHVKFWKRLRSKKGFAYYVCKMCECKWRIPTNGAGPNAVFDDLMSSVAEEVSFIADAYALALGSDPVNREPILCPANEVNVAKAKEEPSGVPADVITTPQKVGNVDILFWDRVFEADLKGEENLDPKDKNSSILTPATPCAFDFEALRVEVSDILQTSHSRLLSYLPKSAGTTPGTAKSATTPQAAGSDTSDEKEGSVGGISDDVSTAYGGGIGRNGGGPEIMMSSSYPSESLPSSSRGPGPQEWEGKPWTAEPLEVYSPFTGSVLNWGKPAWPLETTGSWK